ncbi:MAG: non-ribosomal peptide synthase/polyketide synthase, partial [Halanaerobiales bacterium]|nr:non-ribosomal peptide synthase/polyketide synthase [Halanaerobiales bacterium]
MKNTLENLFYQIVDQFPEKIAIEYGKKSITYFELDQMSNSIANFILSKKLKKGARIGVILDDRIDYITLVLGILKSGCTFVPFDPSYPSKRLETMVDIVDFTLFFADQDNFSLVSSLFLSSEKKPEILEHSEITSKEQPNNRPPLQNEPNDPIYIYFTSGSTGRPKGILGRYKGLVHFIKWEIETFQINENFRTSQFTTPSFDAFLRDVFVPLCSGGTLCIPESNDILLSANKLTHWINQSKINLIHCVPSLFRMILTNDLNAEDFQELKYILMSGERINPKDLRRWYSIFGERTQLVNLYGPSETTMVKTYYLIKEEDKNRASISIGQPMKGARVLILDDNLKPCQQEMVGEIYIRTPFMTLGYYKDPELTQERFIQNLYSNNPDDKLYKTGDLGRILANGNIELIGRKDYQVKIRGVRVELGDIESQLLTHEKIKEVVVIDKKNADDEIYLAAYVVTEDKISAGELKEYLSDHLPEYMIPNYFFLMESFPLLPNGKIDRKALPEPDYRMTSGVEYVAPETEIEKKLTEIWSKILRVEEIGVKDNFFDLGGHSLKVTLVQSKISKELNAEISLRAIFESPTIEELAAIISKQSQKSFSAIKSIEKREYYPVSFAQKRLFALNQVMGDNLGYNMPRAFMVKGELDQKKMEKALQKLVNRQESLRTSFTVIEEEPVQIIRDNVELNIQYFNSQSFSDDEIKEIVNQFIQPFEFEQTPLFRVGVIKDKERQLILFDMHHIISDGISMNILIEEFFALYNDADLPEQKVQYKDFAVWQEELVNSGEVQRWEDYWVDVLDGELPVLNLPTDHPRPSIKGYDGDSYYFKIDQELSAKLNQLANKHGATLYMTLLAFYNILLSKYSRQEDIIVGTPVAGRIHPDLENIIGMFVNTLPMRNYPKPSKTFTEFLSEVKENTLKAFDNQAYQMDILVEKLDLERDMSRNPLFDVMLVLQNQIEKSGRQLGNVDIEPYQFELKRSKFDFILFATETTDGIYFEFEYNTDLFNKETIESMADHFKQILISVIENDFASKLSLAEIELISKEEKDLLFKFNDFILDYPRDKTIYQLFEEQAKNTPEAIAVIFEDQKLTYKEVNHRSNKLARVLRKNGVMKETVVGLMLNRSPKMVISLLAILKAGGAYLPIDPSYPKERILYMLKNSNAKILLTDSKLIKDISFISLENIDENKPEIVVTKTHPYIKTFDQLPMLDRSYIDFSKYKNKIGMASVNNSISLQATRGCPYLCLYCHKVWSKSHVYRSAENIYQEIEYYYKRGVKNFSILDDCFNLNRENSARLFKLIKKNRLDVKIFFPNGLRGDLLTPDYIDLMVEAGTVNINLSLETASPRLQKAVKKYLDIDKFKNVMDYIATQHPNVILELATMHGFPTETEEEAKMTLNFIKDVKWIHFPYIHILKVFPNTEMEEFALNNGVAKEDILKSVGLAYHELPETLPFPKSFTRKYQSNFLNEYFLNPERLKKVLPVQLKVIDEDALLQKYNAYLPTEVKKIEDVLEFAGIEDFILPEISKTKYVPEIFETSLIREAKNTAEVKKILLLDLSQHFSSHSMLYKVAEQPLGLLYLMTYIKEKFGEKIDGRIYKSGTDFDSFAELKAIIDEYQPDLIGIRTLSFYKDFFHQTVSNLRIWGINVPIITGGPYATSEYTTILKDKNIDLVIMGEGEFIFTELLNEMFKNDFKLPSYEVLSSIEGIAYRQRLETNLSRKVLLIDQINDIISVESPENLEPLNTAKNLAYVMYTSGTTGKPKGIMVEHRQVNNCIFWMQDEFKLNEEAAIVQRTNLTFDPSVWEIFWPLYIGAKVKLLNSEQGKDADYLIDLMIEDKSLTMMYCPASLVIGMTYLLNSKNFEGKLSLQWLLIGAEAISPEVVKNFYSYFDGKIVNTYGPTECTINNTYYHLDKNEELKTVPIGRTVANNQIYILSKDLQLLPIGMTGEICIAGESVARGYINNPAETSESFVGNPFGEGKLYKTGDMGRILNDGNIEILGRVDDQVKIRGYRIEPGEIESALIKHDSINDAIVVVKDKNEKNKEIETCKTCGITSAYSVSIKDRSCDICADISHYKEIADHYFQAPTDLENLISKVNQDKTHTGESKYDCLLLYSGGLGSAYALYQLVDMGLNVLTVTFDNGYFAGSDLKNIKMITEKLGVDHVVLAHEKTGQILKESLHSAYTVCNGCFFISSSLAVEYARKNDINLVIGATLSRGQIIENKLYKQFKQGVSDVEAIEKELSTLQKMTPAMNRHIFDLINIPSVDDGTIYDEVKSIDFYRYFDITNQEMISYLINQDSYWKTRKHYAVYSTNCPIKQIGDYYHLQETGYHYYGSATSWEKRLGHITLENLQEDLNCKVTRKGFDNFARLIGFKKQHSNKEIETKYLCAYLVLEYELSFLEIREYLLKDLPDYMVPNAFVTLDKIPLTSNGKVDKKALPEPDSIIETNTEYLEPRNDKERKMANVWEEALGVDRVGVNDNFIELGGDSIKAIQLTSKLNNAGFDVKIRDVFTYQTIAELASHVNEAEVKESNYNIVSGELPLTGIQRWYFEEFDQSEYFTQSVLFELDQEIELEILQKAFNKLIEHHDTLRLNYHSKTNTLVYSNHYLDEEFTIETYDLANLTEKEQNQRLEVLGTTLKASFDLENSILIKSAYFDLGSRGKRLLITIHHLIVDGVSWRILLEDLLYIYQQLVKNEEILLPSKTASFMDWASLLITYSQSKKLKEEIPFWLKILETNSSLPIDLENGDNNVSREITITKELSRAETEKLLTKASKAYNTEINDLLLTALARTISHWTGKNEVLITLEGHGREEILDLDISRTIGCFTSMYPVNLTIDRLTELNEQIIGVKEQLRQIPDKGVGYLILKYLAKTPELQSEHDLDGIIFNYLGQFDREVNTALFRPGQESTGAEISLTKKRNALLEFGGLVADGKLMINLSYSQSCHHSTTAYDLLNSYMENLKKIIEHCDQVEVGCYTPADFPNTEVSQEFLNQIDKTKIEDIYSLTPLQEGMLYHYLLDSNSSQHFEQSSFTIEGELNIDYLEKAWNCVIQNNEVLRTIFSWKELKKPVQLVLRRNPSKITVHDFTDFNKDDLVDRLNELKEQDRGEQFVLENGPNLRLQVCNLLENEFEIIFSFHHILFDGWCLGIIYRELFAIYLKLQQGMKISELNKSVHKHYREYINWLKNQDQKKAAEFWQEYLNGFTTQTNLPTDYHNKEMISNQDTKKLEKSSEFGKKLEGLAKELKVTVNTLLQTAWGLLLQRYNNNNDVVFGTIVSGRAADIQGIEEMVGLFINNIPVRVQCEWDQRVSELLKEIYQESIDRQEFETNSLPEIKAQSELSGEKISLFESLFVFENYPVDQSLNQMDVGFVVKDYDAFELTNYDLNIEAIYAGEILELKFGYNTERFKAETIERMMEHYENLLTDMVYHPNKQIKDIEILIDHEKEQILEGFNQTEYEYPKDKTILQLIETQVECTPDKIAVVFDDQKITYRELNTLGNRWGRILREKGVAPDQLVGILVEPSLEMMIGIIGVLKAGGAYLPIDHKYPKQRIEYMLNDSKSQILLTQSHLQELFSVEIEVICIDEMLNGPRDEDLENLARVNKTKDLAYVIYTSGSTGQPKGVMIENRSLVNFCYWFNDYYQVTPSDRFTRYAGFGFDANISETFAPLIIGAETHILSDEIRLNLHRLNEYLEMNQITVTYLPTQMAEQFMKLENHSLKVLLTGGEKLKSFVKQKYRFCNNYGPTESTVCTTCMEIDQEYKNIPIGKPIYNHKVYVLDHNKNLQPIGIVGELCVSGIGLSRGYLNREDLTNEKFITNPFASGEKMYLTGDLVRWLPDGNIEYISRNDHQVKIRGFRIELGELESLLIGHSEIQETVVIDREDNNGSKYLIAYFVSNSDLARSEIRDFLLKKLPDYMVPSYFVQLDKLPLNAHGKIDKNALPNVDGNIEVTEYVAPTNELQEKLAKIWSDVLEIERIGIKDDFFALGGHSLKGTYLVSNIYKEMNVEIPLSKLFENPTIEELAEYIYTTSESEYSEIKILDKPKGYPAEYYPLSSAQKRIFIVDQLIEEKTTYNAPGAMIIEGNLDQESLLNAFKSLIQRHESLRTSFELVLEEPMQKIHDTVDFTIKHSKINEDFAEVNIDAIIKDFIRPFDLSLAPLLRVELLEMNDRYILMYDHHHIIADGKSFTILISELIQLYNGIELPELRMQYKEFASWQNQQLSSEQIKSQEEYWLNRFGVGDNSYSEIPVLQLPTDYARPAVLSFAGDTVQFTIEKELTKKLYGFSRKRGGTLYMILLSAINVLLSRYSGQEDIIIGSPIAGRNHADLTNISGMFVNTLAMRNAPKANITFAEFFTEVKVNSLKAYENQDYQFEMLVEKLKLDRDMSRNPLFDVMFTLQNYTHATVTLDDVKFIPYNIKSQITKFDLLFTGMEVNDETEFQVEYSTKLFKKETITRLTKHFKRILQALVSNPEVKISEIEMSTDEERKKLLVDFNDTAEKFTFDKSIHQLFEEQVERSADQVAVVFEDDQLTYRELNEKTNKLAHYLRMNGVKRDQIVGMMVDRSPEMIIGILAILKAGGAYLPIDPDYPKERIEFMLVDSNTQILLTQNHLISNVDFTGLVIDITDQTIFSGEETNLSNINEVDDLIYLIYTSGSTGKPKGVMIEHQNVSNLIQYEYAKTNVNYSTKVLQFASISFDVSFQEIFSTLLAGGELYLISQSMRNNISQLLEYIEEQNIEVLFFPAALLKFIFSEDEYSDILPKSVRHIIGAGEQMVVSDGLREYLKENHVYLHNHYGPSETHVVTTLTMNPFEDIPTLPSIGRPISNVQIYILDKNQKPTPIGVPGELVIGGRNVGRGYWNRPELTVEKFGSNPYATITGDDSGIKLYRTGDMARWNTDRTIEFLGRIDHQIKIRGYRIELGEIEGQLFKHPSIKEVAVVPREDQKGNNYLAAYIVENAEISVTDIRKYLSENLPEYMIPAHFVKLDQLPLTANGKVNIKALPDIAESNIKRGTEFVAPSNEVQEKLAKIWSEILDIEKIGVYDNFFEIGGHSLRAINIIARVYKDMNINLPLKEFFKNPTISQISQYIKDNKKVAYKSIQRVLDREYYPVMNYPTSSAQKRMFILHQLDSKSRNYNLPGAFFIEGEMDIARFEVTFSALVERHESLRTSFELVEGEYVQRIHESVEFKITHRKVDISDLERIVEEFVQPFDLRKAPLLRVELVEVGDRYLMIFDMHHIISDGVSMEIIIKDFLNLYMGYELLELPIQYRDFAVWQNDLIKSGLINKQEKYWLDLFNDREIPVLNLPIDHPRPKLMDYQGNAIHFDIDKELTKKLNNLASSNGATLYMVLLGVFNILLAKYSGQEDMIIGTPIAGRTHPDLESVIGMFVNTLVMRNAPKQDKTFVDFLREIKVNALMAYENQDYQFEMLVERLNLERDLSRNPLFDVMFALQNQMTSGVDFPDLKLSNYSIGNQVAKFDLTLNAFESEKELHFDLEYKTKLFKEETIKRITRHFVNLINEVVENPDYQIKEFQMISNEEKEQFLYGFNDTAVKYPTDITMHKLFEEISEKNADHIALVYDKKSLSYGELNEKANQVARLLLQKGVGSNTVVAIMMKRSFELVIGMLGILKAGGAYLPIDSSYPQERIEYMLEDSGAEILLTQKELTNNIQTDVEKIILDEEKNYSLDCSNIESINNPSDLAYIIYTSGTTGKPKGIMIEHRNITNTLQWYKDEYNLDHTDSTFQLFSIGFDAFVIALFGPLVSGVRVVLAKDEEVKNPLIIKQYIKKEEITHVNFVPSLYMSVLDCLTDEDVQSLKVVILGGEKISSKLVKKSKDLKSSLEMVNEYGPTENSIVSTICRDVNTDSNVTIGKPISNTRVYILDKYNQLVPQGVPGEICLSGNGLARGYLNRPELTDEKFTKNPYTTDVMYHTGDLGRWCPDGNIEFSGRIDHQVKIRGYRIELGEIESQLLNDDRIKEAVVLDKQDKTGNRYLVGYLVSDSELVISDIRENLLKTLPDYMIPVYFVKVDKIPLTPNGKIDRKELLKLDTLIKSETEYAAPRNDIEKILAEIWADVLDVKQVGINDNFFELGGQSLKAINVVSKIYKNLSVEILLGDIFKNPTISKLAEYIGGLEKSIYSEIDLASEDNIFPLSSAQKRVFLINQFEGIGISYNMPGVMIIDGDLDIARLEDAFKKLILRHEVLRTSFKVIEGNPKQIIHEDVEFEIVLLKLDDLRGEAEEIKEIVKGFVRLFDLTKAPLLRVGLIETNEHNYLLYDMHHIIADGVSMNILISDLIKFMDGEELPELKRQYKDFAVWQNKFLISDEIKKQEKYWLDHFIKDGEQLPVLQLPTDYQRPAILSFVGDTVKFSIGDALARQVNEFTSYHGGTLYMILLAAFNLLLAKYAGQEDIIVGSPIAGRSHPDLANMVGMFVNTLAMRNAPESDKSFVEFFSEVKENALKAFENQDYQFEMLIEKLEEKNLVPRDLSRNPLFDVMFVLQNLDSAAVQLNDLTFTPYKFENQTSKFDLTLTGSEFEDRIQFNLEYCTKLFKRETIDRMARHFVNILTEIVADPVKKIADFEMITGDEREQILYEFNDTAVDYLEDRVIHEIFEEVVERYPDKVAVVFEDEKISYANLNERANVVARGLRDERGAGPEEIIGILMEPSIAMIVSIFAILKSGAAYLPIDPTYPVSRIEFMLSDSNSRILLTQNHLAHKVKFTGELIIVDDTLNVNDLNSSNLENINKPNDLAYVIYTSGSTGKPKGVMVEHKSLINLCNWINHYYEITSDDRGTKYAGVGFDASIIEIFPLLIDGGELHIIFEEIRLNLKKLNNYYEINQIT